MNLAESSNILKVHTWTVMMTIFIIVTTAMMIIITTTKTTTMMVTMAMVFSRMPRRRETVGSQRGEQASVALRMFIRWT